MTTGWWRAALAVAGCAVVGGVVGIFASPPGGVASNSLQHSIGVVVQPVDQHELAAARVPRSQPPPPGTATYWRGHGQIYGGTFFGRASDSDTALNFAAKAALQYAHALTRHQDALMRRGHGPARIQRLQRSIIREPTRYEIAYSPDRAATPASTHFAPAPWRAGLVGAMFGLLLVGAGGLVAARRWATAPGTGLAPSLPRRGRQAAAATGALALTALLTALASASVTAYTAVVVGLIFAFSVAFVRLEGRPAVRVLVASVVVISAIRGALLGISNAISLPDGLTLVNAIQPAIVAGCAFAVLIEHRAQFPRSSRPLLVGWAVIAAVAILDFATQTVGLHVYAIGLAQYLTYPTLAIVAWLAWERGDSERLVRLLVAIGAVVAVSVFVERAGLISFVEAAAPTGDIYVGGRYGGATGSYLHASIFLGTTAVLALGLVLERWRRREGVVVAVLLALIVGAMGLTLSRGGFAIMGVGALALLAGGSPSDRRRLLATGLAVALVAAVLGAAGGVTPGKLGSRLGSSVNASGDPGNAERFSRMHAALNAYSGLPIAEKAFGEGLAATGNARVVASQAPLPVESYPLKLLLEVGLVGALAIGAYMVWVAFRFAKGAIRGANRLVRSAAAAGLGLSLYGLFYPTLEVQLLAMTWWVLLVACLAATRASRADSAPSSGGFAWDSSRDTDGGPAGATGNGAPGTAGESGEPVPQSSEDAG